MDIVHLSEIPESGVSHDPTIRKKVLIKNGRIPKLTNFSQSVLKPGQFCPKHIHSDMWEVYLVQHGTGSIMIGEEEIILKEGDCLIVDPGEEHSMQNKFANQDLHLTYFGIEM